MAAPEGRKKIDVGVGPRRGSFAPPGLQSLSFPFHTHPRATFCAASAAADACGVAFRLLPLPFYSPFGPRVVLDGLVSPAQRRRAFPRLRASYLLEAGARVACVNTRRVVARPALISQFARLVDIGLRSDGDHPAASAGASRTLPRGPSPSRVRADSHLERRRLRGVDMLQPRHRALRHSSRLAQQFLPRHVMT